MQSSKLLIGLMIALSQIEVPCPPIDVGAVTVEPPSGAVDSRQPHPIDDDSLAALQGIGQAGQPIFVTLGVENVPVDCFSLCETAVHIGAGPNQVAFAVPVKAGVYALEFARPITSGAVTSLYYVDTRIVQYVAHPGNTNADEVADADDVLSLVASLDGTEESPYGLLSMDADHSGETNSADILRVVDLLNGAGLFDPGLGTPRPSGDACP